MRHSLEVIVSPSIFPMASGSDVTLLGSSVLSSGAHNIGTASPLFSI